MKNILFSSRRRMAVFIMVASLCAVLTSCEKEDEPTEANVSFDVSYVAEFQNTLYPSLLYGFSEYERLSEEIAAFFTITVNTDRKTDLRIVIEESKVNFETVMTEKNVNGTSELAPAIKWKWDELKNLKQPGNVDITFVCNTGDGLEVGRKDMHMSYRSINECLLAAEIEGEVIPLFFLFAGYVNEDSPVVDAFLKEVLQTFPGLDGFSGYQLGIEEVVKQVMAIFLTLREKGVKYSSITATSSTNPHVASQYVRFADEVLDNTQANCADGTVFICSILQKIGISTAMIFAPGHVYLGYYITPEKSLESLLLLETTTVGNKSFSFEDATYINMDEFYEHIEEYANDDWFDDYIFIDIDDARQMIKPIGRSVANPPGGSMLPKGNSSAHLNLSNLLDSK